MEHFILLQAGEAAHDGLNLIPYILVGIVCIIMLFTILALRGKDREIENINKEKNFEIRMIKTSYSRLYENSPLLYFVLNPRGIVNEFNRRVSDLLHLNNEDLLGKSLKKYFRTIPPGQFEQYLRNIINEPYGSFEVDFVDAGGKVNAGTAYVTAAMDVEGEIASIQMVALLYHQKSVFVRDQEARRRIEKSQKDEHTAKIITSHEKNHRERIKSLSDTRESLAGVYSYYGELCDHCPLINFILSPEGVVIKFNRRVTELLNYKLEDLEGRYLDDFFHTYPPGRFEDYLETVKKERSFDFEVDFLDASNNLHAGTAYCAARRTPDGKVDLINMMVHLFHQKQIFIQDEESKKRIEESLRNTITEETPEEGLKPVEMANRREPEPSDESPPV